MRRRRLRPPPLELWAHYAELRRRYEEPNLSDETSDALNEGLSRLVREIRACHAGSLAGAVVKARTAVDMTIAAGVSGAPGNRQDAAALIDLVRTLEHLAAMPPDDHLKLPPERELAAA